MHLGRGPHEAPDDETGAFYAALLACLRTSAYRDGDWQLLGANAAWEGNGSHDAFLLYAWSGGDDARHLVVVNYADHHSQCRVTLPWPELAGSTCRLYDQLGTAVYDRDGTELVRGGLYLDLPPWGHHAFAISRV